MVTKQNVPSQMHMSDFCAPWLVWWKYILLGENCPRKRFVFKFTVLGQRAKMYDLWLRGDVAMLNDTGQGDDHHVTNQPNDSHICEKQLIWWQFQWNQPNSDINLIQHGCQIVWMLFSHRQWPTLMYQKGKKMDPTCNFPFKLHPSVTSSSHFSSYYAQTASRCSC